MIKHSSVLTALLLLIAAPLIFAENDKVVRVVDPYTIVLERIGTARLVGVELPGGEGQKSSQKLAREATEFTRRNLLGKTVQAEYDWQLDWQLLNKNPEKTDTYSLAPVYIFLEDGTFFNAELVKQGYAQAYKDAPFRYSDYFQAYEKEAREAKKGLWKSVKVEPKKP